MKPNKNKHANILKTGILLFGIFLLLWSCQKEDIQEDVVNPEHQEFTFSTVSKSLAKDVFNSYLKKQEQIQSKRSRERDSNLEITPDWNSFKQENLGFTDALLSSVDIKTNARANKLTSRLIFLTVNDKVLRVIKSKQITAFKGDKPEQGFVYYHNLNGNFIVGFKIENGEVTKKLVVKGSINKASFLSMVIFQSECDEGLNQDSTFCNNNLEEVEIYVPSGNQNRGEESSEYWFINGSSSWGDNYHDYDTDDYGDSDGGGGGGGNSDNNGDVEEIILDSTFLANEKLMCVYNKLIKDNSSLFKNTVGAFIDNPNFNLKFKVGNCANTDVACTDNTAVESKTITIIIEDSDTNPIELAQIILHEAIHAELAKYVYEYKSNVDPNNRAILFQWYKYYKEANVPNYHLDHPYMSANYINPIASALRKFDDNRFSLDYYKSFAWDGLRNWDVNRVLKPPMEDVYGNYRSTVIKNSIICN